MKWLLIGTVGLLGLLSWQFVRYLYSPQGKFDSMMAGDRAGFTLKDVMGTDLKAICFLPPSHFYPVGITPQGLAERRFIKWLEISLGRSFLPKDLHALHDANRNVAILTDKGFGGYVRADLWNQDKDMQLAKCTRNPALKFHIENNSGHKVLSSKYERYFLVNLGMEVNLDGNSE